MVLPEALELLPLVVRQVAFRSLHWYVLVGACVSRWDGGEWWLVAVAVPGQRDQQTVTYRAKGPWGLLALWWLQLARAWERR